MKRARAIACKSDLSVVTLNVLAAPPLDPSLYLALRARRWLRIAK